MKKKNFLWAALLTVLFGCPACDPVDQTEQEKPQLPILSWYSIPAEDATLERYLEMKEAGININFSHIYSMEDAMKSLDLCQQAGIKSMFMTPELKDQPEETVKKVMNHPALAGYFLADEPGAGAFDEMAEWAKKIRAVDSTHSCYLNLLPSHAGPALGVPTYREYVRTFIEKVPMEFYSFDYYPVNLTTKVVNGDTVPSALLSPPYFENLEIFSEETRRVGKPFWAFSLATAHGPYPIPTMGHMRLQMYSNLAYGAQGLQYFTYWNPSTEVWDFNHAPITLNKKRCGVYDRVRELNKELQARAFVFVGCQVQNVFHTGASIPQGTKPLAQLPAPIKSLTTEGEGAVVSFLKNGDVNYAVIVNRALENEMTLNIEFTTPVQRILKDGSAVCTALYEPFFWLGPGEAEIFCWKDGETN